VVGARAVRDGLSLAIQACFNQLIVKGHNKMVIQVLEERFISLGRLTILSRIFLCGEIKKCKFSLIMYSESQI